MIDVLTAVCKLINTNIMLSCQISCDVCGICQIFSFVICCDLFAHSKYMFTFIHLFPSRWSHKLYEIQGPQNLDLPLILDDFKKQEN